MMEDLPVQRHMTSLQYRYKNMVYHSALEEGHTPAKAVTLASVWFNVHFLACKYPPTVMDQIEKYTPIEYKEYMHRRTLGA